MNREPDARAFAELRALAMGDIRSGEQRFDPQSLMNPGKRVART